MKIIECNSDLKQEIRTFFSKKAYDHCLTGSEGKTFAAIENGKPAGFISLKKFNLYAPIEHEHDLLIWIIEVRPEYRRKGIARALIKRAADYGREMGSLQLRAWSSSDKTAAIPMWKSLGFGLSPGQEHQEGKVIHGYHATRPIRKKCETSKQGPL